MFSEDVILLLGHRNLPIAGFMYFHPHSDTTTVLQYLTTLSCFSVAPLSVNYSGLASEDSPGITATLNSLCAEPLNHFFVGVLFGIKIIGGTNCRYMQSRTVLFIDARTVFVPLDTDVVIIPAYQAADYEYCAKATLNEELCDGKLKACILLS